MANKKYKLSNSDYWATDGVWDFGQGKTQRQVNSDLNGALISTNGSWLAGKKVSIIGDSIDTFNQDGYKVSGYSMYYPADGVTNVNDTWWMRFINASGASLEVNASYSGSYVTSYDNTMPDLYARTSSNIIGNPDVIIIALGLNDNNHSVSLGNFDYTTTYTSLSEAEFRPAYIKGIKSLQANFPNAQIVCVIKKMLYSYYDSIMQIAMALNCICIDAREYTTQNGAHPGIKGMREISSIMMDSTSKIKIPFFTHNIEPYSTAGRGYAMWDYIIHNNKFYRVLTNISNGDALVNGTNIEETTILEELRTKLPLYISKDINIRLCGTRGQNNIKLQFSTLTASGQKATVFLAGTIQTNEPIADLIGIRPENAVQHLNLNLNRQATPSWSDSTHVLTVTFPASGYDNFIVFATAPFTQVI